MRAQCTYVHLIPILLAFDDLMTACAGKRCSFHAPQVWCPLNTPHITSPYLTSIKWKSHLQNHPKSLFCDLVFFSAFTLTNLVPILQRVKTGLKQPKGQLSEEPGGPYSIDLAPPQICLGPLFYRPWAPTQNQFISIKWGHPGWTLNSKEVYIYIQTCIYIYKQIYV